MRIHVFGSAASLPRSWHLRAEQRARDTLKRFARRLSEVRLRLRDANGPRSGVDKEVLAVADIAGGRSVRIEERDADSRVAIRRALRRLALALSKHTDRRHTLRRRRLD
jgi:ribosome-associated translation inhibitor RaiA